MTPSQMISEMEAVREAYGEIELSLQSNPAHDGKGIVGDSLIFVVPEEYEIEGKRKTFCNIRSWPY
jgi:hypothetical protein